MDSVETDTAIALELDSIERWAVFARLRALSIPCECSCNQPLLVEVETATALLQVWSVVQQVTQPRRELATRLDRCWRQPVKS